MREGVVREQGTVQTIFSAPQDAYTKALLACRPRLDVKPRRLPVIDDFMKGTGAPIDIGLLPQRVARAGRCAAADHRQALRKEYRLKTGFFQRKSIEAVKEASFDLHKGRTLGVVGESGSGKTTVGMMLMRLREATQRQILFEGTDLLDAVATRELHGVPPAHPDHLPEPVRQPQPALHGRPDPDRADEDPRHRRQRRASAFDRAVRAAQARRACRRTPFDKYPHEFSGGQRQRIAIARCLTMKPEIMICDEAVSALDVSVQATVLNLLLDLQDEFGLTYIFISHDLAVVKYMADDILVMNEGEIVERGSSRGDLRAPAARVHAEAAGRDPARLRGARCLSSRLRRAAPPACRSARSPAATRGA